jgi:hypothetical protein
VGSLSANDGAQRNQASISSGLGGRGRSRGELERAGQPDDVDLLPGYPCFAAAGERTIEELRGDDFVIAADQDRHSPGGAKAAGKVSHVSG